ncbi:MAG: PAS domain S-box protein, partial [Acidobacteriaceae bacterium]
MTGFASIAEQPRLQTLDQYELLEMPRDPALDDISHLAAQICDTPAAAITFVEKGRISLRSRYGIDIAEVPRHTLPCELALAGDGVYQVPDAHRDYAPAGIPVGDRRYRFYAGAPIVMPSGAAIGCLCVFDSAPRVLSPAQLESLEALSRAVVTRLELTARARQMDHASRARRGVERALTVERNFVSAVLDTVGALVVIFDTTGRIVRFNRACETLSGHASADLVGNYAWERLVPTEDIAEHVATFQRMRSGSFPASYEQFWLGADGSRRRIAWTATALEDARGQIGFIIATGIDITVQVRAEEQLRALVRQSNSVLESVGDGIYGLDLEGRVTVVNPAAAQMLGYKPEEMLGRNMHELVHHTRADGTPYPHADCPSQRSLIRRETIRVSNEVFWRKDGSSFAVEYVARPQIESDFEFGDATLLRCGLASTAQLAHGLPHAVPSATPPDPIRDPEGRAVGVVIAFADISERNALDRMKDEFISTVSHELRTPLTSLRAALGLVAGGALTERPEQMRQMMNIAIGNTDRLVRLVNDILDLESIGSGKVELHSAMCSVDDLFRRAVAPMQTCACKANIEFAMDANGVNIWADPERILQTLTNLISNAIKFSPQTGAASSKIRLTARYSATGEALIEVHDEGRGIPEDKLEIIFDRFKQVDASDSRAMGGTGLGLAICRSIVAQHGGTIWATSTLGNGSTFHFALP